ncbi:MAG: hypothetical protein QM763_11580 [Agriterribacter sp.]
MNEKEWENDESTYIIAKEAEIELENLLNDLDSCNYTWQTATAKFETLQHKVRASGISSNKVDELCAMIFYELGDYAEAVNQLKKLQASSKAKFSVEALEKYSNVRCKHYMQESIKSGKKDQLLT